MLPHLNTAPRDGMTTSGKETGWLPGCLSVREIVGSNPDRVIYSIQVYKPINIPTVAQLSAHIHTHIYEVVYIYALVARYPKIDRKELKKNCQFQISN